MDNVVKLKNLMVSACSAIKDGNRDIGLNLLELAADVMVDVEPEVIETQFVIGDVTKPDITEEAPEGAEENADDFSSEMQPEEASQSLRDILSGWIDTNAQTV